MMREAIHGNQGALGDVIWAQSFAIKEASSTRERRIERVVHDCEEELHDEEAAEHDDEEEVDPHVPDEGCNQTSSSKLIRLHHYSSDLISGHQDAISGNQDIPRKGLHQIVHHVAPRVKRDGLHNRHGRIEDGVEVHSATRGVLVVVHADLISEGREGAPW